MAFEDIIESELFQTDSVFDDTLRDILGDLQGEGINIPLPVLKGIPYSEEAKESLKSAGKKLKFVKSMLLLKKLPDDLERKKYLFVMMEGLSDVFTTELELQAFGRLITESEDGMLSFDDEEIEAMLTQTRQEYQVAKERIETTIAEYI